MTKHPYLWKHHLFSSCSKIMMRFSYGFEMSSRWRCLGTEPKKVEYYPPTLPSVFFASLTSKSYCSVLNNPGYDRNCQLRGALPECMLACCSTKDSSLISVPAPDGHYCRGNMVCLGGKCETKEPAKKPR
uniref:Putative metalloprotease n=1 Tax=Ixodes ricinus TaxID=34613 RepID=A0A0K8RBQ6_IXORI